MSKKNKHYWGWLPDLPDPRDFIYKPTALYVTEAGIPFNLDLRNTPNMPLIYDQGALGSCVANAVGSAFQYIHKHDFTPSRLLIYYNARQIEGTINLDAGAYIRDGIKTVASKGVCDEKLWPYNIAKFKVKPPINCYTESKKHRAISYFRVPQTLESLKICLAEGFPIVFGFSVFESFETVEMARTGIFTMPKPNERVLGGHAVKLVGYNDATQRFIVKNSWGTRWGQEGYFELPYPFVSSSNYCDDFWTIRVVS